MNINDLLHASEALYKAKVETLNKLIAAENKLCELRIKRRDTLIAMLQHHRDFFRDVRGNITQKRIAKLANVTQSQVSWFETGRFSKLNDEDILELLKVYAQLEEQQCSTS